MAYEKQTWVTGETITAQKLNHMEDGIANCGLFVVTITYDDELQSYSCDKTNEEIYNAWVSGANVVATSAEGGAIPIIGADESAATFNKCYVVGRSLIVDYYEIYTEDSVQTVTSSTYNSNNQDVG